MPQAYHRAHKRIESYNLGSSKHHLFQESRHNAIFLSRSTTSFSLLRGEDLCPKQHSALKTYHDFNTANPLQSSSTKIYDIINAYFPVFDDFFFFGSLQRRVGWLNDARCAISAGKMGELVQQKVKQKGLLGKLLLVRTPNPGKNYSIVLYDLGKYSIVNDLTKAETLELYLGTLVHEMLHAYFDLWACNHEECKGAWEKSEPGHGFAWLNAAHAIEKAAGDRDIFGLSLKLRREMSLAEGLLGRRKGLETLAAGVLEGWEMQKDDVESALASLKRRESKIQ